MVHYLWRFVLRFWWIHIKASWRLSERRWQRAIRSFSRSNAWIWPVQSRLLRISSAHCQQNCQLKSIQWFSDWIVDWSDLFILSLKKEAPLEPPRPQRIKPVTVDDNTFHFVHLNLEVILSHWLNSPLQVEDSPDRLKTIGSMTASQLSRRRLKVHRSNPKDATVEQEEAEEESGEESSESQGEDIDLEWIDLKRTFGSTCYGWVECSTLLHKQLWHVLTHYLIELWNVLTQYLIELRIPFKNTHTKKKKQSLGNTTHTTTCLAKAATFDASLLEIWLVSALGHCYQSAVLSLRPGSISGWILWGAAAKTNISSPICIMTLWWCVKTWTGAELVDQLSKHVRAWSGWVLFDARRSWPPDGLRMDWRWSSSCHGSSGLWFIVIWLIVIAVWLICSQRTLNELQGSIGNL